MEKTIHTELDDKYLKALLENDNTVISEIYERFFPKTSFFILKNSGTITQAKDIFQEALLYIIMGIKERKLSISCFEAYLFTVTKNMWRREVEKQKKRVMKDNLHTLVNKEVEFASFMIEQEHLELYQKKFDLLSSNCKDILTLFFNGTNYEDITTELSYANINTVRQRVFKCKSKLVKLIKFDTRFN